MNPRLLLELTKTFDSARMFTTEMQLENRLAKVSDAQKLFIRVSTQYLGGRFDTKA